MNRLLTKSFDFQVKKTIQDYGKDVVIYYSSTANPYAAPYDPVYKEPVRVDYATTLAPSSIAIKGVVYSWAGKMNFFDYSLSKQGYVPDADLRLTCWLSDVLMHYASVTGPTYFDKSTKVMVGGRFYAKKKTFRTGVDTPTVLIVTLEEKKNYDPVY